MEFIIENIRTSMHYSPFLYYEAKFPSVWHNATLRINRRSYSRSYLHRVCKDVDNYVAVMNLRNNSVRARFPSVCLEAGSTYTMRLDLFDYGQIPEVLIDAVSSSI